MSRVISLSVCFFVLCWSCILICASCPPVNQMGHFRKMQLLPKIGTLRSEFQPRWWERNVFEKSWDYKSCTRVICGCCRIPIVTRVAYSRIPMLPVVDARGRAASQMQRLCQWTSSEGSRWTKMFKLNEWISWSGLVVVGIVSIIVDLFESSQYGILSAINKFMWFPSSSISEQSGQRFGLGVPTWHLVAVFWAYIPSMNSFSCCANLSWKDCSLWHLLILY